MVIDGSTGYSGSGVVVVSEAIGVIVVDVGATCGSPGHHGIEARRRAWVDRFSYASWVHDPPVGY